MNPSQAVLPSCALRLPNRLSYTPVQLPPTALFYDHSGRHLPNSLRSAAPRLSVSHSVRQSVSQSPPAGSAPFPQVRLWSTELGANLMAWRGHMLPVWDVAACPSGYLLASTSADRTAHLWCTEHLAPQRIFVGRPWLPFCRQWCCCHCCCCGCGCCCCCCCCSCLLCGAQTQIDV